MMRVALFGLSHVALMIGRACSLKDRPPIGIYDPDPAHGLKASLFLGVSALAGPELVAARKPDLLVCSIPWEGELNGCLLLNLHNREERSSEGKESVCWVTPSIPNQGIPDTITSVLPPISFRLEGENEPVVRAQEFLTGLSPKFSAETA